jgi:hypothetical protein
MPSIPDSSAFLTKDGSFGKSSQRPSLAPMDSNLRHHSQQLSTPTDMSNTYAPNTTPETMMSPFAFDQDNSGKTDSPPSHWTSYFVGGDVILFDWPSACSFLFTLGANPIFHDSPHLSQNHPVYQRQPTSFVTPNDYGDLVTLAAFCLREGSITHFPFFSLLCYDLVCHAKVVGTP